MIIGLLGFIGSGKGTVGDILVENNFTPLSFAGSLKDAVSSIFSWDRALLEGDTEESRVFRETVDDFWSVKFGKPITPRYILQYFGTEVCRENLLDNIWVHSLERKIQQHENVVVTDVRFKNEISFLKSIGAVFVQIDRAETRPNWYSFVDFLDMFGTDEAESAGEAASETPADENAEGADVGEWKGEDSAIGDAGSEWTTADADAGTDANAADPVDAEMEALFKQLESEANSENPEQNVMDDIINELRMKSAEDAVQLAFYAKQNESLQNRLLESASKDTDQVLNQPLISKVEADPKLRAIIHLSGNQDEAAKQKYARLLGDMYSELTGIDITSLAEESQNNKMAAALGAGKSSGAQVNADNRESINVSYEESTNELW